MGVRAGTTTKHTLRQILKYAVNNAAYSSLLGCIVGLHDKVNKKRTALINVRLYRVLLTLRVSSSTMHVLAMHRHVVRVIAMPNRSLHTS